MSSNDQNPLNIQSLDGDIDRDDMMDPDPVPTKPTVAQGQQKKVKNIQNPQISSSRQVIKDQKGGPPSVKQSIDKLSIIKKNTQKPDVEESLDIKKQPSDNEGVQDSVFLSQQEFKPPASPIKESPSKKPTGGLQSNMNRYED